MGKPTPACSPKETRIRGVREVSLGFNKKIAQDEARRCPQCAVATCLPGCPLGIDIPGFIRLLREGDTALALERIKKDNPFPAICGRICPAPCEQTCVFHADGQPIAIRALERFASDFGQSKPEKFPAASRPKKTAVIGSGPAGMSAAYYLAKAGLGVTIFEAAHEPGGLLRYGVPEFRLPQKILDEQFAQLRSLGVEVQTDAVFGRTMNVDELFMRGFSAVVLAAGTGLPRFSQLPGSDLGGVYYDMEFLSRLQNTAKDRALEAGERQDLIAAKTVVVGRGPSAFDAARLILRLGSATQMVFESFEEEAGVDREILTETKDEGIELHSLQALEILGDEQGFAAGVKCRKLEIVEDKEGLKLQASAEDPIVLEARMVIIANGQRPNDYLKQNTVSNKEKIFDCGHPASVVEAIAAGKITAQKTIQYLGQT